MAVFDPDTILAVRRLILDTTTPYIFSDPEIEAVLTEVDGDVDLAAGKLWRSIAAKYHKMTDITEAGSSRKLSQMFENALKMAAIYDPGELGREPVISRSTTRPITRA